MLVDKPAGPTSHDVVAIVRRTMGIRSAGHTGTLDPFATGLLVILLGRATRLARFVSGQPKRYLATARLGFGTTTDDLLGEPLPPGSRDPGAIRLESLAEALGEFVGKGTQRPPAFSARHVDGERSYRLARRGVEVELPESDVTIHEMTLVAQEQDCVTFRVTVSAGTYIRAIARDLGERLGTGAHLTALRREAIGPIEVSRAVPLAALTRDTPVLSPLDVVAHLPVHELDDVGARAVGHGRSVAATDTDGTGAEVADAKGVGTEGAGDADADRERTVALVFEGRLVAVASAREGRLHPSVVLESA